MSDFEERHKYRTDPSKADSDGDGRPDGDWDERREFTYTVRSVVRVMRPAQALSGDYQDARVRAETDEYVELEVIHYPLSTTASTISGSRTWREASRPHGTFLRPGLTANWDEELRAKLLAGLGRAGIDPERLTDLQLVQRAVPWLLRHAPSKAHPMTTFATAFREGKPYLPEELRAALAKTHSDWRRPEALWPRDLFAKGMFETRTRGSCTSTAIYLTGCLRALGIPTRIVLTIPAVDASNARQRELVQRLRHHRARETLQASVDALGPRAWSSHTFNEVFVGGRWRRLNDQALGQGILDRHYLGLMTHVLTVDDWSAAQMTETVGRRQTMGRFQDAFGGPNPYAAVELEDAFGVHAQLENPRVVLRLARAFWYASPARPKNVTLRGVDEDAQAGHVLLEAEAGSEPSVGVASFWNRVDHEFRFEAKGHPPIRAQATRGYWWDPARGNRLFYVRIPPEDVARMKPGVPYRLRALNGAPPGLGWDVGDVQLSR